MERTVRFINVAEVGLEKRMTDDQRPSGQAIASKVGDGLLEKYLDHRCYGNSQQKPQKAEKLPRDDERQQNQQGMQLDVARQHQRRHTHVVDSPRNPVDKINKTIYIRKALHIYTTFRCKKAVATGQATVLFDVIQRTCVAIMLNCTDEIL